MPYFPQNHPEFNGLRHLILMYGGRERHWREDDLLPYVAHLDQGGRPDDWLFDSFLFLNARARSGNDFCADVNLGTSMAGEGDLFAMVSPHPATLDDRRELLEFYLGPDGAVRTLDRTIGTWSLQLSGMQELIKILNSSALIDPFSSTLLSNASTFILKA